VIVQSFIGLVSPVKVKPDTGLEPVWTSELAQSSTR